VQLFQLLKVDTLFLLNDDALMWCKIICHRFYLVQLVLLCVSVERRLDGRCSVF